MLSKGDSRRRTALSVLQNNTQQYTQWAAVSRFSSRRRIAYASSKFRQFLSIICFRGTAPNMATPISIWPLFYLATSLNISTDISSVSVTLENPWHVSNSNLTDQLENTKEFKICFGMKSGVVVTDVHDTKLESCQTPINTNTSANEDGLLKFSISDLKPGTYFYQVRRTEFHPWINNALQNTASRPRSIRVTGWSKLASPWPELPSIKQETATQQLLVTVPVPPKTYLLQPDFSVHITDSFDRSVVPTFQIRTNSSESWQNETFAIDEEIRNLPMILPEGNYNITIQPSGLPRLCSSSNGSLCNYNGTCSKCPAWRIPFTIQPWEQRLSTVIIAVVTVLALIVVLVIISTVVFRGKIARHFRQRSFAPSLWETLYSVNTSGPTVEQSCDTIGLIHIGSREADCLKGEEIPNRGDSLAVGDALQDVFEKLLSKKVVRYDGRDISALKQANPQYVLVTLTDDLHLLHHKYRVDSSAYCHIPEEHEPVLGFLKPTLNGKYQPPKYTMIYLFFEHVPSHIELFTNSENPSKYKLPDGLPDLMCLLNGLGTEQQQKKTEEFRNSTEVKRLGRIINRCRLAGDVCTARISCPNTNNDMVPEQVSDKPFQTTHHFTASRIPLTGNRSDPCVERSSSHDSTQPLIHSLSEESADSGQGTSASTISPDDCNSLSTMEFSEYNPSAYSEAQSIEQSGLPRGVVEPYSHFQPAQDPEPSEDYNFSVVTFESETPA